jgi:hypothetical protein
MSVIQKFSIEKINKIRKILLLYIDKEIKSKNKINHLNCLTERFSGKDLIYQNAYSTPINLEQKFSNEEDQNNINQSQIEFNQNSYSFKAIDSLISIFKKLACFIKIYYFQYKNIFSCILYEDKK